MRGAAKALGRGGSRDRVINGRVGAVGWQGSAVQQSRQAGGQGGGLRPGKSGVLFGAAGAGYVVLGEVVGGRLGRGEKEREEEGNGRWGSTSESGGGGWGVLKSLAAAPGGSAIKALVM